MASLASAALAPSSVIAYNKTWSAYLDFVNSYSRCTAHMPLQPADLARFVGFMFERGLSSSTIRSRVAHLSYLHKMRSLPDPADSFIVKQVLKGCRNLRPSQDGRLPITSDILGKLVGALDSVCPSFVLRVTLKSMFLLAFHAFLRVGELTVTSSTDPGTNLLRAANVVVLQGMGVLRIAFTSFKHHVAGSPVVLHVRRQAESSMDPVQAFESYRALVAPASEQAPCYSYKGNPVRRALFCSYLASALRFCGMDPSRYKSHSFRIGAATCAAQKGYSEEVIKALGRWSSGAFRGYIRFSDLTLS